MADQDRGNVESLTAHMELTTGADLSQLRPYAAVTRRRTAEAMRASVIGG